ncbi:MAG: hypothetical protein ACYSWP_13200 [Planctomycetota bacterium]|jgi:hypothetical protein
MIKLGSAEINGLMIKAAGMLRDLQAKNDSLEAKLAERDRLDHAEKIAAVAAEKGIFDSDEAQEYAENLAKSDKDLEVVEDFVDRHAAGVPLGDVLQKTASDGEPGDGESAEDRFASQLLTSDFAG